MRKINVLLLIYYQTLPLFMRFKSKPIYCRVADNFIRNLSVRTAIRLIGYPLLGIYYLK